jgi:large subunit ribosomal protein L43
MCSRGIFQLKAVDIFFCKHGGSSTGTRNYLHSSTFEALQAKNPQISFNVYQRNGNHPYITSKYINGYIKDIPLRNADPKEVEHMITKARNSFGRKALPHAGLKVFSTQPSIQGIQRI